MAFDIERLKAWLQAMRLATGPRSATDNAYAATLNMIRKIEHLTFGDLRPGEFFRTVIAAREETLLESRGAVSVKMIDGGYCTLRSMTGVSGPAVTNHSLAADTPVIRLVGTFTPEEEDDG